MSEKMQKVKRVILAVASRRVVVIPLTFAIAFLCIAASLSSTNTFVVYDGENVTVFNSNTNKTSDALAEMGITIDETEYADMPEKTEHGVAKIYIYPKKKVSVKIADTTTVLYSEKATTLSELFAENNVELSSEDIISTPVTSVIEDGMEVEITRVSRTTIEEYQEIPFATEKRASSSMNKGTSKTVQSGVKGSKKVVYAIELQNGKEVSRNVVSETTVKEPTAQIVEYGTKVIDTSGVVTTWSGSKLNYKKKISMTATAYTTERTSDKITATGKVAKVGLVAVDPRVIPLGSKLYIVSADGKSWCYGTAVAADTGVRGNKIDLFFNTYNECISFGRRKATVYVLK